MHLSSTTLRPHPGDVKHILSMAAASETAFLLLLFFLFLFWRTNGVRSTSFIWFCIFFSFSFLLSIGFTVNFLGAIVRYRSIILPFLLVPVISLINWERIYSILFNNIKNNSNVSEYLGILHYFLLVIHFFDKIFHILLKNNVYIPKIYWFYSSICFFLHLNPFIKI